VGCAGVRGKGAGPRQPVAFGVLALVRCGDEQCVPRVAGGTGVPRSDVGLHSSERPATAAPGQLAAGCQEVTLLASCIRMCVW
jgi:hypothetical protein